MSELTRIDQDVIQVTVSYYNEEERKKTKESYEQCELKMEELEIEREVIKIKNNILPRLKKADSKLNESKINITGLLDMENPIKSCKSIINNLDDALTSY